MPVLFQEQDDPQLIRSVPAKQMQESIAAGLTLALGDVPAPPDHGFVGRSRELLTAERLLETERYIVLQGEGGEGKTTLAAELARWLVLSRRFERSAFVAFDKVPDARAALWSIGAQLVPNYVSLAGQDAKHARQLVERALADHATVIVLDNMETILPPAPDSPALSAFEPKTLGEIRWPVHRPWADRQDAAHLHEPRGTTRAILQEHAAGRQPRPARGDSSGEPRPGRGHTAARRGGCRRERAGNRRPGGRRWLSRPRPGAVGREVAASGVRGATGRSTN